MKEANMLQLFTAGDVIKGYCNGFFGRDDYKTKTCVMVAVKYAVFEYQDGFAVTLNYDDKYFDKERIAKWKKGE